MIAQAGATFTSLGVKPENSPLMPSVFMISLAIATDFIVLLDPPLSCTIFSPSSICSLVFITSIGRVIVEAIVPDTAPATKFC